MRFVPIKSDEQLDMQSLHRVRDRWVARRTSVINQIRGLLLERGITFRKGRRHAAASLPAALEDADNRLSGLLRMLLAQLQGELRQLQSQIDDSDALIAKAAGEHEPCRRLMAIPGIGPLTATAVAASIGNGSEFRKGRSFAAWLGLVPKQESTGGKQKLLGISKAWQPLPAQTVCERSTRCAAVQGQAVSRSQCLARPACIASSHQRRGRRTGQQDGSRRMGGAGQK